MFSIAFVKTNVRRLSWKSSTRIFIFQQILEEYINVFFTFTNNVQNEQVYYLTVAQQSGKQIKEKEMFNYLMSIPNVLNKFNKSTIKWLMQWKRLHKTPFSDVIAIDWDTKVFFVKMCSMVCLPYFTSRSGSKVFIITQQSPWEPETDPLATGYRFGEHTTYKT